MSEILNTPKKSYGEFKEQKKRAFTTPKSDDKVSRLVNIVEDLIKRIDVLERRIHTLERGQR